jgi:hypothetical protein
MSKASELKKQAEAAHDVWCKLNNEWRNAARVEQEALQKVCTHPKTKIEDRSYHEYPMRETAYWREKVCCVCKKVLAQTSQKEVWSDR